MTNYIITDYQELISDLISNRELKDPNLNEIKDILKLILSKYNNVLIPVLADYWKPLIDDAIIISLAYKDHKELLNDNIFNTVKNSALLESPFKQIEYLKCLLVPSNGYQKQNTFFECMEAVVYFSIVYLLEQLKSGAYSFKLDYGNDILNGFIHEISSFFHCDADKINDLKKESSLLSIIVGYMLYHNINDYDILDKYLRNPDYYKEKIHMRSIEGKLVNFIGEKYDYFNNMEKALIFKNINVIFNEEKKIIK